MCNYTQSSTKDSSVLITRGRYSVGHFGLAFFLPIEDYKFSYISKDLILCETASRIHFFQKIGDHINLFGRTKNIFTLDGVKLFKADFDNVSDFFMNRVLLWE